MLNTGMSLHAYELISFKPGMIIDMMNVCIFHTSVDDLDLHSRSQGFKKHRASAIIRLKSVRKQPNLGCG